MLATSRDTPTSNLGSAGKSVHFPLQLSGMIDVPAAPVMTGLLPAPPAPELFPPAPAAPVLAAGFTPAHPASAPTTATTVSNE
jgi:hypothetical protein